MMDMEKLGAELLSGRQGGAIRDMANSPEAKKLGAAIDPAAAERAVRSGDAAQARCTELQGHSKTVLNGGIVTLDAFQLGLEVSVVQLGSEPTLIHILIHK